MPPLLTIRLPPSRVRKTCGPKALRDGTPRLIKRSQLEVQGVER